MMKFHNCHLYQSVVDNVPLTVINLVDFYHGEGSNFGMANIMGEKPGSIKYTILISCATVQ